MKYPQDPTSYPQDPRSRPITPSHTATMAVIDAKATAWDDAVLATNDLGEESLGTPAISGGRIFIHTSKAIYCLGR